MMKRNFVAVLLAALMPMFVSIAVAVASYEDEDTDTRMVDAKVVEVADAHISIMARSGVEHVIAVDASRTKVTVSGAAASLKDIRDGDFVTVELDAKRAVKFANFISVRPDQVAKVRR